MWEVNTYSAQIGAIVSQPFECAMQMLIHSKMNGLNMY